MKKIVRQLLPVIALFSLSSCALPPREAWRVIQNDGLFPYFSVEMGRRPVPGYVHLPTLPSPRFVTHTPSAKAPGPAAAGGVFVVRPSVGVLGNRYLNDGAPARAQKASEVMEAPKPVLHLTTVPVRPNPAVSVSPPPRPLPVVAAPAAKPDKPMQPKVDAVPPVKPASISAEIAVREKPKAPPAEPATEKPAPVADAAPLIPLPTKPDAAPASPVAQELPFGKPVPGRPGLVNSPYAGSYQLVDVTGLSPGQEVKCPYSGKVFRVPSPQQAANAAKAQMEAPPAAKKSDEAKKP